VTRLLFDLNVLLDVLLDRKPHAAAAAALWGEIERGRAEGLVPAHGMTTIAYLAQRARGRRFARRAVADLLSVFGVATVDDAIVRRAAGLDWTDFEDAVCAVAAQAASCAAVVTRDPHGYRASPVPALDAPSALALVRTAAKADG